MKCQSATSDKLTALNWQVGQMPGNKPEMQNPATSKAKLRMEFGYWRRKIFFLWILGATTGVVVNVVVNLASVGNL